MPDNVDVLDAANATVPIATDDVAGVQFQKMKLDLGGDGLSDPVVGAMPVTAAALPLPTGAATAAAQTTGNASLASLDADVGALADAAAAADGTGNYSLIAAAKRALLNWATLLARVPALIGGRVPVDGSGVTQPVSLASAPLPANAATVAGQDATNAILTTIDVDTGLLAARTPALGQATMAASRPVAIASDQTAIPSRIASYTYPISTGNSSTAQLAAGATFTGTIETPQDQPSLSILLTSDQPITLTVRQYIDVAGTFQVPAIVFYVAAGAGFARSLTLNGNFFRIEAQNTGASTTTTFRLDCALGTLGDVESTGTTPVTELPLILTGAAAQTAVVNNILEPTAGANGTAAANFRAASVQVVSTGTGGTFIFEQSNDGTNWIALPVFNAALVTGVPITAAITATASQIVYTFPIRCNFVRLRIATTITGGSLRAFTRLSTEPWTAAAQLVASNTAANLQTTVIGTVGVTGYPTAAASADAFANPTVTKLDALGLLFNGTTWDRARGNAAAVVETSSARTATGTGTTQTNFNARGAFVWVNVTAVTGTTPTMTVRVQWSPDGGTNWLDLDTTNAQTASITGTGASVLRIYPGVTTAANAALSSPLPRTWRLAWTITGTTPSFTFAAQATYIL